MSIYLGGDESRVYYIENTYKHVRSVIRFRKIPFAYKEIRQRSFSQSEKTALKKSKKVKPKVYRVVARSSIRVLKSIRNEK